MPLFRKLVIYSHRYLGIAFSLLVIMWFATGIAMIYVGGMPRVAPQTRLDRLAPIDLAQVKLTPAEAAEAAAIDGPARPTLLTVLGRPAYRFSGRYAATVFADNGEPMEPLTVAQSQDVAAHFAGVAPAAAHHVATLEDDIDQWTMLQSRLLPLHKFAIDDADGTELYVQADTGEIVMHTTASTRAYAWVSTIPHFMYFTALRVNQPLWYKVVVWTSGFALAVAVLGLILGVTLFRIPKPFSLKKAIPYSGWMRWHYITGLVFGVFTATWAFSGLLSMEPWAWTNVRGLELPRNTFTGGAVELTAFAKPDAAAFAKLVPSGTIKEIEYTRLQDEHYYVVRQGAELGADAKRERLHQPYYVYGRASENRLLVAAATMQPRRDAFSTESLLARVKQAVPGVAVTEQTMLTEYDDYYYSRGGLTPLPVLRVKMADPDETWLYIDPANSALLSSVHKFSRVERWLYNGLHSLDFAFWYHRRPLWDLGMLTLLFGGLASSIFGLVMGVKRMRRAANRALAPAVKPAREPMAVAGD